MVSVFFEQSIKVKKIYSRHGRAMTGDAYLLIQLSFSKY